ncbi:MAG: AMP-binding protein [Crocinitomicaceae bacterium]|nr:AMP-binding protein [Flavobacteriales bacterium]NQZ36059.1 AMP-binding protein [Crocinitomicaceae bacterium]
MAIRFVTNDQETKQKVLDFIEEWNDPSEEIIVKTSGSTGHPKEIQLLKKHMIASAKATGKFLGLKAGDSSLLCLSMDTIGGRMMVVRSLVLNLDLVVSDVTSTPIIGLKDTIQFAAMVPMQIQKSLSESPDKVPMIKRLIVGGGPVSNDLIEQIQEIPTKVFHTFGMTETISHIAMRSLNHPLENEFKCLPGITIAENKGSLVISAPEIGVHQLETNDAIEIISPSAFRWLGRTDFVINSGGVKLHPEEIESKLTELIYSPFYVYGEADQLLGEKLILIIENLKDLGISKNDLQSLLTKHAVPKEIRYVSQFDYTQSGKINRLTSKALPNVAHEVL